MILSEMTTFLKYDQPTLYRVLSQFHFRRRGKQPELGTKNLKPPTPIPPPLIKSRKILASGL